MLLLSSRTQQIFPDLTLRVLIHPNSQVGPEIFQQKRHAELLFIALGVQRSTNRSSIARSFLDLDLPIAN